MAPIADALRYLRTAQKLSQTAAGKLPGGPDFRTISHWETDRKLPSMRLLLGYLAALKLDFHDLQDALDHGDAIGTTARRLDEISDEIERLAQAVAVIDRRMFEAERTRVSGIERRLSTLERLLEVVPQDDALADDADA